MKKGKKFTTDPSLKDHRRHGKKLIAPFSPTKIPQLKSSQWVLQRLPEIIWIAELIEHLGDRPSLDVLTTIVKAAHEAWKQGDPGPSFIASSWAEIRDDVRQYALKALQDENKLEAVRQALTPLHALYPAYPLRFLFPSLPTSSNSASLVTAFKNRFVTYFDRFERPALKLHSHIFIAEVKAGLMRFPKGTPIPNFDLIYASGPVDHDDLETSHTVGFIRSSVMSIFAAYTSQNGFTAGPDFWQQGLILEPCSGRENQ